MILELDSSDEVYIQISCEPSARMELNHYFRFRPKNYQFMPMFRAKKWDGYVYLFNYDSGKIYSGLKQEIKRFAKDREYQIKDNTTDPYEPLTNQEYLNFLTSFPCEYKLRDYQSVAIRHAIDNKRCLLLSPTASGKSLIIYYLIRYYFPKKTLIIVPTLSLVSQMYSDFDVYAKTDKSFNVVNSVHKIFGGQEKNTNKPIVISTWQSLYELNRPFFSDFKVVIGDEAHLYKAKSLTKIMKNLNNTPYRVGTTGTLDEVEVHKLILTGLFGPVKKVTTTKELIKKKTLSEINIRCLVLKYSKESCMIVSKLNYQEEIDFLVSHTERNKYICNLVENLRGNSLVLFQLVEKHGNILFEMLRDQLNDSRKVFFVYGGTDADSREKIRAIIETEKDAVICASYGVYSTGINIRNLHNIVFASPSKSRIRNLQSIGRGLRKSETKNQASLYDIADNLTYKEKKNYTLNHFMERVKIYSSEQFPYHIYTIPIKG
ncbi:MAG: DEAD/DEAH box helicase family protein [Candidatus Pacebacteria bacterium]|jgi:superfamily II DNA or RNA helicase|nr:DEAD/DEAH box helicase family protein [Candidatus Paceibacterota bacterium]|tara:strand:- start:1128 stop:2594 length:1467 start_codon:yes stop_codon:yes gene_type:complete